MLLRSLMLLKDDLKRLQIIKKKLQRKASLCYDWLLSLGNKLLRGLKITLTILTAWSMSTPRPP